jgi:hypothetical protein
MEPKYGDPEHGGGGGEVREVASVQHQGPWGRGQLRKGREGQGL